MKSISLLLKPVSGNCNMNCSYCFYKDELKYRQTGNSCMDRSILKQILGKAINAAEETVFLCFQGGEPLLAGLDFFKDVIELQKLLNIKGISIVNSIQTNGILIDDEWCRFFKENGILVGVSLDGIKNTHDRYRVTSAGNPTYDTVMRKISLLKTYDVNFNILTVVSNATCRNIKEIYLDYKRNGFLFQQYILCRDPLFEDKGLQKYSVTPEEYGDYLVALFDLWRKDILTGEIYSIRLFENYVDMLFGFPPENCEQGGICGSSYAIEANGDVYPCDFYMIPEYKLGNIIDNSLEEINQKRKAIRFIEKSASFSEQCLKCNYLTLCRNGCQRNRIQDRLGKWQNYYCKSYYSFFEKRISQIIEVAEFLGRRA